MTREEFIKALSTAIPRIEGKNVYIWGTGDGVILYQEGLKRLAEEGVEIYAYGSDDESLYDGKFCGKEVFSAGEIADDKKAVVLVCLETKDARRDAVVKLRGKGIECFLLDDYVMKSHGVEILGVYDSLCGDRSKAVFSQIVYTKIAGGDFFDNIYSQDRYFASSAFAKKNINEVFVDCGGYVGNTVETYLQKRCGVFKKIIMFEPDMGNFRAAKARRERLVKEWNIKSSDIEMYPYLVTDKDATVLTDAFENYHGITVGSGAQIENNDTETASTKVESRMVSLDVFLDSKEANFIKVDLNGGEYNMLLGAKETITQNKPKIAVNLSANAVNFYQIALLLKDYVPEYKFAVRHHSYEDKDTVLYAWVD